MHVLIVQPAIDPYLIDNRKFHIRVWCILVKNENKLDLAIIKKPYIRLAPNKYNSTDNHSTQMSNHKYDNDRDLIIFDKNCKELSYSEFMPKIVNYVEIVFRETKSSFDDVKHKKWIWPSGWDFILDPKGNSYLLEINSGPSFFKIPLMEDYFRQMALYIYTNVAQNQPLSNREDIYICT